MTNSTEERPQHPTLTLRGGGWIIIVSLVLSFALFVWAMLGVFSGRRPVGDGENIESYNFDLSNLSVPREVMAGSGNPRDFLTPYDYPENILGGDMVAYNQMQRRAWIVTADRVVGVEINGETRAYPVRCLNAHEIIHDSLGGVEITVTYSPFADAAVVFETEDRHFGVSGLLMNSMLLFYDRDAEVQSLFSPALGRAISGPLLGTKLHTMPLVTLCTWRDWLQRHPDTTVILADPATNRRYRAFSYMRYFNDPADRLHYPVAPLPKEEVIRLKARVVAVTVNGERRVWPLTLLTYSLNDIGAKDGTIRVEQNGVELEFTVREMPQSVLIRALDDNAKVHFEPRLWFSWWCSHPETANDELVQSLPVDAVIEAR